MDNQQLNTLTHKKKLFLQITAKEKKSLFFKVAEVEECTRITNMGAYHVSATCVILAQRQTGFNFHKKFKHVRVLKKRSALQRPSQCS